jgi:molybdenum cofactor biosynthesis enzyme MoaA
MAKSRYTTPYSTFVQHTHGFQVCLFDAKEVSLRDQMRQGASDAELLRVISTAVRGKAEKHEAMNDIDVVTNRSMILIGG